MLLLFGCSKSKFTHKLIIINKCSASIICHSAVTTYNTSNGTKSTVSFNDPITINASFNLRNFKADKDIVLTDYFDKIQLEKSGIISSKDFRASNFWVKKETGSNEIEWTLTVVDNLL